MHSIIPGAQQDYPVTEILQYCLFLSAESALLWFILIPQHDKFKIVRPIFGILLFVPILLYSSSQMMHQPEHHIWHIGWQFFVVLWLISLFLAYIIEDIWLKLKPSL